MVHQPAQQLHRQIFEGKRRAVKKFEHEQIVVDLRQWRDGAMGKAGVCGACRVAQDSGADLAGEGLDKPRRRRVIGKPGEGGDVAARDGGVGLGDIEPPVGGEARQEHVVEGEFGSFAAGRNIMQWATPMNWPGGSTRARGADDGSAPAAIWRVGRGF